MNSVSTSFVNALLSDATYALNINEWDNKTGVDLEDALSERMTPNLAKYIGDNFTVVTHIETNDVVTSGFDATVWKNNSSGKIYVSFQGTTGLQDFLTDVALAFTGNAGQQVIDMANWWLKITTPIGEMARQIGKQVDAVSGFVSAAPDVPGLGLVSAADLAQGVEVSGHSLGGYLATAFTRLFGSQAHVEHNSTFNSAGFALGSESAFANLQNLIGPSYGLGRFPNAGEQSNYFAANGLNVTTNSLYFSQVGQRVELYQEEGTAFPNHYMYKLTDLLALGAALEKLAPASGMDLLNQLSALGSNNPAGSLEGVLNGLRHAILGTSVLSLTVGDAGNSDPARMAYHEALSDFQDSKAFQSLAGKVTLTPIGTNLATQGKARVDFQTFVALYTLSPFVMNPAGAEGQAALAALWASGGWQQRYQEWQADKVSLLAGGTELVYSNQWYEDRAALLHAVNLRNFKDLSTVVADAAAPTDRMQTFTWLGGDPLPGEVLPTMASLTYLSRGCQMDSKRRNAIH